MEVGRPYRRGARATAATIGLLIGIATLGANAVRLAEQGAFGSRPAGFGPAALGRLRIAKPGEIAAPATISNALYAEPLAWEPFLAAGQAREAQHLDGRPLLEEAARRNPHALAPRLALITAAALRGDMHGLGDALLGLHRIAPANAETIATQIGRVADSPDHARQAVQALAPSPPLLAALVRGFADPAHGLAASAALLDALPAEAARTSPVRPALIAALVQVQRYHQAYRLWSSAPAGERVGGSPFDWQLSEGAIGSAEHNSDGSVTLTASGQGSGALASRLFALPAGDALRLIYRPRAGEFGALLARMRCAETGRILASQPLAAGSGDMRLSFAVTTTEGCSGQYLDLMTQENDDATPQQADVIGVEGVGR